MGAVGLHVEGAEELEHPDALEPRNVLPQSAFHSLALAGVLTEALGLLEETIVELEVGRHRSTIAQRPTHRNVRPEEPWRRRPPRAAARRGLPAGAGGFIRAPSYDVKAFGEPPRDVAVVHGWGDEVVPVANAIRFARAERAELTLLEPSAI